MNVGELRAEREKQKEKEGEREGDSARDKQIWISVWPIGFIINKLAYNK